MPAVLFDEPDAQRYATAPASAARNRVSAANFLEAAIAIEGRAGEEGGHHLDALVERVPIETVEVTVDHVRAARSAWRRFGRGNHPAGLNFGDCFAYALADTSGEPLLFKGPDFTLTGIRAA